MTVTAKSCTVRFIRSIADVDGKAWNALAGEGYPFLRHEFLLALESSGCADATTGWQALHALVEQDGILLACMPLYARTNSMGEYVFDWAWADAYSRHGMEYYPKLITAIPFTPCAGPRICVAEGIAADTIQAVLVEAVQELAARLHVSGWHVLFPEPELRDSLNEAGLMQRTGCQYQWFNAGYQSFEQFLDTFSSRKRKNLRKERAKVSEEGISFKVLEGPEITATQWQRFYLFYQSTYFVRGRSPYLNEDFFTQIGRTMPEHLLLILACKDGKYIAGALFFKGSATLYGRYWGCTEEFQFLHFETCYYQGIDYCIRHGIARIDSGAQGEHKIQRGFKPVSTWSNHWIANPDFAKAIQRFLKDEEQHIANYVKRATDYLPFRKDLEL